MSKRSNPFPYKTVANDLTLAVSSISIENITIQSPNTFPTYTLTLPPDDGAPGQILSTDGSGVLSWINDSTGGTVTSVSASVPSWLSVTVTNATTTPLIAITGTATGTGITVLQDSPTINTLLTVSGQLDIPRNSGSGHAVKITNAHAGVQDNYIEVGKNSSNRNHAHFGHHFEASGDAGNYAFIQTNSNFIKFAGTADFTFPATASANNGNLLFSTTAGVTSWSNTFNNGMTGYFFNSPVDFNAQVLINTNLILNSTLQVNGDLLVNQNTANGRLAYFYNDSVHENVGNQIYVGQDLNDSVQLGHYYATNVADRYAYLQTNNTKMIFTGEAAWKFPTTLGTSGQSLITNGAGVTSWADRVSAVSATVPSFMSVTVTNPNTTPAIAISATSTGSGGVVLATSPTIATPTFNQFATVSALSGPNDSGTLIVRGGSDVYISKYKSGATGVLNNAFMITTNPANPSNTFFYTQGSSVGIFSQAPQETLDVQGSIRASNFIRFNNVSVYPGSSGVTSLYLPTSPGTNGQVLTSTGSGTAMTWTTPTTGTVTSVTGTSPIISSGGATPDISLSTVPTTLGGTGLTSVGTNGQVLTSNGTTLGWTTPTTGTVTSVAATSPLASSGGATPTISIASSTGTGSVVLNGDPVFQTAFNVQAPTAGQGYLRFVSTANTNYIQSALTGVSGSTADLVFGTIGNTAERMVITAAGYTRFNTSVGIGGTGNCVLGVGEGAFDTARYGTVSITQSTTITNGTGNIAQISFIRKGNYVHGLGYRQNSNIFGFGAGVTSNFQPSFISIDPSNKNIGMAGTLAPAYSLDLNTGGGFPPPTLAVRDGFSGGFRTQWNVSGGQGETDFWNYRGGGAGGFYFKNLDTLNTDVGWAQITCGYTTIESNGETLLLKGTDHTYIRFNYNNTNRGFLGYSNANTSDLAIVNTMASGGVYLYAISNIFLDSATVTVNQGLLKIGSSLGLGPNPSTSAYTFRFPASMGTSGQVLTTDGTNTYWSTSGGGGGGGSVNSVTASAPLASSGGTAPNISIASATGSGAVVLSSNPTIDSQLFVQASTPSTGFMKITSVANANYIQSGLTSSGGSTAPLIFTSINAASEWMRITDTGNVGIGTTNPTAKLHVNGSLRVQGAAITQNGAQSEFSNGSYSDPDSGQVYNAKFGNTDPLSNGIAVKGNSRFTSSVRAANFTTNSVNFFTYSETDFTPLIGFLTGATNNFVAASTGASVPSFSYNIQTGRISRIGSIMTVVVDISFNIQFSIAAAPGIYIAIRLPEECRPASVGATAGGSWPQSIDPSNMRGYVLLNGTDSGGNIAYISPVNVNERLLWSIYGTSPQSNQRLFVTMTYILR